MRGPSSVIYGSQNMGGVINIILKTGRTAPGTFIEGAAARGAYVEGKAQNGGVYTGFDWYVGGYGGRQRDYPGGRRQRRAATPPVTATAAPGSFGWQIDQNNRIDVTARSDGVYGTGFRGSSANIFAYDNRYNSSIDVTWHGKTPASALSFHVPGLLRLRRRRPQQSLAAQQPERARLTHHDRPNNRRQLDIVGFAHAAALQLIPSNELLVGVDWEQTSLRSTRFRAGGTAVTQLSPQDNNELNRFCGFYAEDTQQLFDDRRDRARRRSPDLRHAGPARDAHRPDADPRHRHLPGNDLFGGRHLPGHRTG